eukprot:scaffold47_cov258-Pinguiococcus_pyrenoidosus.AAC.33
MPGRAPSDAMFPVARVKAVAKADPDIGRVQTAAYDATASAVRAILCTRSLESASCESNAEDLTPCQVEKFVAGLLRAAAERSTGAVGVAEVLKAIKEEVRQHGLVA